MTDTWQTIKTLVDLLDHHSSLPREQRILFQLLKIQEEAGEVAEAAIGAAGQNPRKGFSHTQQDIEDEVCDVIVTAMVALMRMNPDAEAAFERHMDRITTRGVAPAAPTDATPKPPGTAALLVNDRGQYLLHLRDANKPICHAGMWSMLGGHPEPGESPDQAIRRELREETGLTIPDLSLFAVLQTVAADGSTHDSSHVYSGSWDGSAHEIDLQEGIALRWTDADEIQWMNVAPGTIAALQAHHGRSEASSAPEQPLLLPLPEARSAR